MITVPFSILTDGSGDYTETAPPNSEGPFLLEAVEWIDGTLDNGVDFVLSSVNPSGVDRVLCDVDNADDDAWYQPRIYGNNPATGATWANGADLTAAYAKLVVAGPLKLVVANGGNAKSGKLIAYLSKC